MARSQICILFLSLLIAISLIFLSCSDFKIYSEAFSNGSQKEFRTMQCGLFEGLFCCVIPSGFKFLNCGKSILRVVKHKKEIPFFVTTSLRIPFQPYMSLCNEYIPYLHGSSFSNLQVLSKPKVLPINFSSSSKATVLKNAARRESRFFEGVPIPPPPDLPSLLLSERVIYCGSPLTTTVSEIIIAQLLFLEFESRTEPIVMYINSPGTENNYGQPVAFETEALGIVDVMNYVKPPVHTVCIGQACGTAAMILASGKKSYRFALPNATVMLRQPLGSMKHSQAADIALGAAEKLKMSDQIASIISLSSGKSKLEVKKDLQRNYYMSAEEAKNYGVIDKIMSPLEKTRLSGDDTENRHQGSLRRKLNFGGFGSEFTKFKSTDYDHGPSPSNQPDSKS